VVIVLVGLTLAHIICPQLFIFFCVWIRFSSLLILIERERKRKRKRKGKEKEGKEGKKEKNPFLTTHNTGSMGKFGKERELFDDSTL